MVPPGVLDTTGQGNAIVVNIQDAVADFIVRELLSGDKERMPGPEEPLIGPVVDSIGLHRLIAFLESEFRIDVGDLDIVPENFGTLSTVVSYVERQRGG